MTTLKLLSYKIVNAKGKPFAGVRNCKRTFKTYSEMHRWRTETQRNAREYLGERVFVFPNILINKES